MIETSNPEIDVAALLERVRREAAKVDTREPSHHPAPANFRRASLPSIGEVAPPPLLGLSQPPASRKEKLDAILLKARRMLEVAKWIPRMFHRFLRRQSGFNRAALEALQVLTKSHEQLHKRVQELMTAATLQDHWARTMAVQRQTEVIWMKTAAPILAAIAPLQAKLNALETGLADTTSLLDDSRKQSEKLTADLARLHKLLKQESELNKAFRTDSEQERLDLQNLRNDSEHAFTHLRNLQVEVTRAHDELTALRSKAEALALESVRLANWPAQVESVQQRLERLEQTHMASASFLRGELAQQRNTLSRLSPPSPGEENAAPETAETPRSIPSSLLDEFYLSFENRFRGERSQIKQRAEYYLPFLRAAEAGTADRPVVDLGCGRGEWLELLRDHHLEGRGIDINQAMLRECAQRGLQVTAGDALAGLRSIPDASLGAVTGFHLIEHLALPHLMEIIGEVHRVLLPGGLAIFESPNCKNVIVGASYFNIDPTHRNPVFPETAQFILEMQGFAEVQLHYLVPSEHKPLDSKCGNSQILNELFFGAQDFAVIGKRPAA